MYVYKRSAAGPEPSAGNGSAPGVATNFYACTSTTPSGPPRPAPASESSLFSLRPFGATVHLQHGTDRHAHGARGHARGTSANK